MSELLESFDRGVLTLTLNRPERLNALNDSMTIALLESLRRAAVDSGVRVVILAGAGKAFCSGGDVKDMASSGQPEMTMEERVVALRNQTECARLLHEMPKPTIAVTRGWIAGAGLSLALACDFLIAADNVKITSAFVKVGLSGDFGGSYFLARRLGAAATRSFVLLSPVVPVSEAKQLGLVTEVVADAELDGHGAALARRLADGPSTAFAYIKANLNFAERGASLSDVLDHECLRHIRCILTDEHREASAAFVEKRTSNSTKRK